MWTSQLITAALGLAGPTSALKFRQTSSFPPPEPCTGNCTAVHDPAVIRRSNGTWLRFSKLGNIAIASVPALTGPWTYEGAMLPDGSTIKLRDDQELWAPDVFFTNDQFYAYYSVSKNGYQGSDIGVAKSKTGKPWISSAYNIIDANFFRECDTCDNRCTFGSAWDGVFQTSLTDDYLKWSGEAPKQLPYNSTYPAHPQDHVSLTEGGFLLWWEVAGTKYYYMFFYSVACCNPADELEAPGDEYKIMVCRATPSSGPFFDKAGKNCSTENGGTLVLGSHGNVYAPGGQGVLVDDGKFLLYYHYADTTIGYAYDQTLFGFNYVDIRALGQL
ncbi:Arabinanase/levansucrase/invertase [Setomelanomma holmii]|uniref:Endo-1,5-alpha-L-arabinanase A n=1 Tax=Setomelanomma holmii TaxID=210430 RepID=A0A9P4GZ85_9PLEO|nr:Arabinanase/levansucrase/invertase [Setomelanomma holmii]